MSASDDLHRKIEQVAGKEWISCPICGNQDWLVDVDAPMTFLMLGSAPDLEASLSGEDPPAETESLGSHHFVHATCERCGFVRLHDVHVLGGEDT